ncbi:MAG: SLC13 family permease [Longimicrobiales bacterium]|nr:SLC13 family permease [Longimicrobiales bacterium]
MTLPALLTLVVVIGAIALLVTERLPAAVAMIGAVVVLLVFGVVTPAEALGGFSNPAPFTVAALYVIARGVEKTGMIQPMLARGLREARGVHGALARLLVPVTAMSALFNNTPIVALLTPQVEGWARRTARAPSRFLLPLSYAAILGGTLTAVGTSTTLVVSGMMQEAGLEPMRLFDITPWSAPLVVIGVGYLILLAPRLLPERRRTFEELEEPGRGFMAGMRVEAGGAVEGRTVEEAGLRDLPGVFLTEVERGDEVIAPATPETLLKRDDRLIFVGRAEEVAELGQSRGLRYDEHEHAVDFHAAGHTWFEAVVGPQSRLVGETLKTADFRSHYQAAVVGIHRAGASLRGKLGSVSLRAGDTLLLLTDEGFRSRWRERSDFLLIARMGGLVPANPAQVGRLALILGGMVALLATGVLPILHGVLAAAFLLVATGVLTPGDARRAVDFDVILLIASAFGVAAAMRTTGLAEVGAGAILTAADPLGRPGAVAAIIVATLLLTELITNNAAAVLVYPLALGIAGEVGIDPVHASLVVAVAASASFLTPIGYQTNTMVWGPGGYRIGDYLRLGAPLTLLVIAWLLAATHLYAG